MPKQKSLQKPKRIRKNKKDFFRGAIDKQEFKTQDTNTIFPFRYILLFSLLTAAIFLYTPLTFLFSKLPTINFSFLTTFFGKIHVTLPPFPGLRFPQLHINLPVFSIDTENIFSLFTGITKSLEILFLQILRFTNPLPLFTIVLNIISRTGSNLFTGIIQISVNIYKSISFLVFEIQVFFIHIMQWIFSSIQNILVFLVKNLNPLPLLPNIAASLNNFFAVMENNLLQGILWFFTALRAYFVLLGNLIVTTSLFVFHGMITLSSVLAQVIVFTVTTIVSVIVTLLIFIEKTIVFVTSEIMRTATIIILGIFHFLTNTVQFVSNSILGILLAILGLIMKIIEAIKEFFAAIGNAISQFFHQFDPITNFVGTSVAQSLNGLFSNIGQLFSTAPVFFGLKK